MNQFSNILSHIRSLFPFELKKGASVTAVLLSFITVYIFAGFLEEIGSWLFSQIGPVFKKVPPLVSGIYKYLSSTTVKLTLLQIIISVVLFIPIYRIIDRYFLRSKKKETIFIADFTSKNGWGLNYWGPTNPDKNNRLENGTMVFEATEDEVTHEGKEFGACIDIRNAIYSGFNYEISCKVKSDPGTTMGFKLWVHDTVGRNDAVSEFAPKDFFTPPEHYQTIKLNYKANSTNAIRVHLHNRAGLGKITVSELVVTKIN